MRRYCGLCGAPVRASFWRRLFGPPMVCEEHAPDAEPEPEEDDRPDDLWDCTNCQGCGEVVVYMNEWGYPETEGCRRCDGTGVLPW